MKRGGRKIRGGSKICDQVWRRGWQREAAATQAASAEGAGFILKLEQSGLADGAEIFRRAAMLHGVQDIEASVETALRGWRAKREQSL